MKAFVFDWKFLEYGQHAVVEAYCIQNNTRERWQIIGYKPYCFIGVIDENRVRRLMDLQLHYSSEPWYGPSTESLQCTKRYVKVWFDGIPSMTIFTKTASSKKIQVYMNELDPLIVFLSTYQLERTGWVQGTPFEGTLFRAGTLSMTEEADCPPIPRPRIACLDIECFSSKGGMPKGYDPQDRIEMISIVCEDRKCLVYIDGPNRFVTIEGCQSISCLSEQDLIVQTFEVLKDFDPDVITGYNIFGFDFRYILSRLSLYLDPLPDISRYADKTSFKKVEWESSAYGNNDYYKLECTGRISFDAFLFFRRFRLEKHSLDYVAEKYLGEGKDPMPVETMFQAFRTGDRFADVASYCIKDSELVLRLLDRFSIWEELCETSRAMDCAMGDIHTRGEQMKILSQVARECILRKIVLVRPENRTGRDEYQGAYVLEPTKGIHGPCTILDFQSLYPSIMIAFNICPSTYVASKYAESADQDTLVGVTRYPSANWIHLEEVSHGYNQKPQGILPGLAEKVISKRKKVKERIKNVSDKSSKLLVTLDKRQNALKIAANSIYGAMGAKESQYLFHVQSAESITAVGRNLLKSLSQLIPRVYGVQVLYGDTDSCMIQASPDLCKKIASEITGMLPSPMSLNFEASYDRIFLLAKKMYVLYRISDGFIKYKGVINARRGYCHYAKGFYEVILKTILESNSPQAVVDRVNAEISRLTHHQVPMEALIMTKSVRNLDSYKVVQPHVAMALRLRSRGFTIEPGTRLEYVFAVPGDDTEGPMDYMPERKTLTEMAKRLVSMLEWDPKVHTLDQQYYIEKQVARGVNSLTETAGWGSVFLST